MTARTCGSSPAGSVGEPVQSLQNQVLDAAPKLLARAIDGYRQYTTDEPPTDPKGFLAYQAGCRAALTHVHLVIKLAQWARGPSEGLSTGLANDQLELLLREAEAAVTEVTYED